jgi:integrase
MNYSPVIGCNSGYLVGFRGGLGTNWVRVGATRWQGHQIPLRTVQAWLGHKNLETTQRYLGVTDSGKLRGQIDAAFGD